MSSFTELGAEGDLCQSLKMGSKDRIMVSNVPQMLFIALNEDFLLLTSSVITYRHRRFMACCGKLFTCCTSMGLRFCTHELYIENRTKMWLVVEFTEDKEVSVNQKYELTKKERLVASIQNLQQNNE